MAKSIDNFDDLNELCLDSEIDDSLTQQFNKAANHLQSLLPNVDNQMLLTLYGYYKQGLQGPCNTPKPSWYDLKAKSKWESWNKLGNLPQQEAKTIYIETIKKLDPNFDESLDEANVTTTKETWVSVSMMQNESAISESEKTLIDYVKEENCEKVKNILQFDGGANVINEVDENGLGLIHWAADRGSVNILQILISHGANINLQDCDGQTALHYASSCGHIDCIKFLLKHDAKKDILDNDNLSPMSVANDDAVKELFI